MAMYMNICDAQYEALQVNNLFAPILTATRDLLHAASYCNRDSMKYSFHLLANNVLARDGYLAHLPFVDLFNKVLWMTEVLVPNLLHGLIPLIAMEAPHSGRIPFFICYC